MIEAFLSVESRERLQGLIGRQVHGFGSDLEIDDRIGAFSAWLRLDAGWLTVEFLEDVLEFPDFESAEPVLTAHPLASSGPGGTEYPLGATVTAITRIQESVTSITKPAQTVDWEWWRDAGLRFSLDDGRELLFHCPSSRQPSVLMRTGSPVALDPVQTGVFQEGEKRRYDYSRREVEL